MDYHLSCAHGAVLPYVHVQHSTMHVCTVRTYVCGHVLMYIFSIVLCMYVQYIHMFVGVFYCTVPCTAKHMYAPLHHSTYC